MGNPLFSTTDKFFGALRSHWAAVPPGIQDSFLKHASEFTSLESRLREDEALLAYDTQLYPELVTLFKLPDPAVATPTTRSERHFCAQQIRFMETVFLALKLDEFHAHPLNRGWMNLFRRWTAAPTFRKLWLGLRGIYGKEFVDFADYQLNLESAARTAIKVFSTSLGHRDGGHELTARLSATVAIAPWPFDLAALVHGVTHGLWPDVPPQSVSEVPHDLVRCIDELNQEWPIDRYRAYWEQFTWPNLLFLIGSSERTVALPEQVWGAALLGTHPSRSGSYRLIVWIRPGYRRLGLGTQLLREVVTHVPQPVLEQITLHLPPLARDKPGYGREMSGWLHFFGKAGFVQIPDRLVKSEDFEPPYDPQSFYLALYQSPYCRRG